MASRLEMVIADMEEEPTLIVRTWSARENRDSHAKCAARVLRS
jgi:hypothetical protein